MNEYDIAAAYIKERIAVSLGDFRPELAIILGSGLGGLADEVETPVVIPYGDIPGFSVSTAPNHRGRLVVGLLGGRRVICMQGRLHYYEGHSMQRIIFPVRVFARLGVGKLIVTNAAGGIKRDFTVGDIMLIDDHINLQGTNPLVGPNDDSFGERFCDMTFVYVPEMKEAALRAAEKAGVPLRRVHRGDGAFLRDAGGDTRFPRTGRGRGGDVYGAGGHRSLACGYEGAGLFADHKHGGRHPQGTAVGRRGHRRWRAAVEGTRRAGACGR